MRNGGVSAGHPSVQVSRMVRGRGILALQDGAYARRSFTNGQDPTHWHRGNLRAASSPPPADRDQAAAALVRTGTFLPKPTFNSLSSRRPLLIVAFTVFGSISQGRSNTRKMF